MAYITFRMDASKDLIATTTTKIYQNEKNMDSIAILLPQFYDKYDLRSFTVKFKYIDLLNQMHSEELEPEEELYQEQYYRYLFPITAEFTAIAGEISFMLEIAQGATEKLHTNSATVTILPWKDYIPAH